MSLPGTVIARIPKGRDMELHYLLATVDGESIVILADYAVSQDRYYQSMWSPVDARMEAVMAALVATEPAAVRP